VKTTGGTSRARVLARGLTRRCGRCGSRGLFTGWFTLKPECPRCGLVFEREEGSFLGAFVINFAATELVLGVTIVALVAATLPDIPPLKLSLIAVPIVVAFPIGFYPLSKTLWIAIDLLLHPDQMGDDLPPTDHHR
jgi:uncharacterized protein (DUF983 family)